MAGYSGTPLLKKLGLKEKGRLDILFAPAGFIESLSDLPADASIAAHDLHSDIPALDLCLLFAADFATLDDSFGKLKARLNPAGRLWVAYYKKAANIPTDLDFDRVQHYGLAQGLVDTKICAIDALWSGLCFVYRLKDR